MLSLHILTRSSYFQWIAAISMQDSWIDLALCRALTFLVIGVLNSFVFAVQGATVNNYLAENMARDDFNVFGAGPGVSIHKNIQYS